MYNRSNTRINRVQQGQEPTAASGTIQGSDHGQNLSIDHGGQQEILAGARSTGLFERLFRRKCAIMRHLDAPLLLEREAYLRYQMQRGRHSKTLCDTAELLLHVIRVMDLPKQRGVSLCEIQRASEHWAQEYLAHRPVGTNKTSARRFTSTARDWFRFQNLLLRTEPVVSYFDCAFTEFACALNSNLNYLPTTIRNIAPPVRRFLLWVASRQNCLSSICLQDIDDFLNEGRSVGWRPRTIAIQCQALRTFFRFAESRNWCRKGFARTIRSPVVRRLDWEVTGPSWKEVRRLVKSIANSSGSDCRAKAILLLASVYGLRNTEITRLTLDDFTWQDEVFVVKRLKRGRLQQFPIQYEVGQAIIRYLQTTRPQCACRSLFVTMLPPYRPLENLAPMVRKLMNRAGIISQTYGTHALRHACATELLRRGTSLRDLADFLGHRDLRSVGIYAKHDERSLRAVAKFSLENML
jgi:integrase/recombinase XerD